MSPPLPLYRGQGNQPFKTAQPQSAAKRGQTVPYDVNGKPAGPIAGALADGTYGDVTVSGTGTVFTVLQSAKLTTARSIAITGDGAWNVTFDGSAAVTAALTLATVNANTGTFGGATTSPQFSVDGKGRITGVSAITITPAFSSLTGKPTTLSGYGITDAQGLSSLLTAYAGAGWVAGVQIPTLTAANTITLKTVGSATGNILDKASGDALYLAIGGTATAATKLATGRTIAMTGDVAWTSPAFDGTGNVTAAGTIQANAVTFAKFVAATQKALVGATAAGNFGEVTLGAGLTLVAGVLDRVTQTTVSGNAGTATTLQTSRNIDGQAFNGSADITVIAPGTHAATSKTTPVDADELPLVDSAASNVLKKLTWANLKATLKTYLDTLYQPLAAALTSWAAVTRAAGFDTFAATPSSANLVSLITDETGTGALVFGTTPTLTTPVINGLPTGTGVAATSTASTLVARDANKNILANNFLADYTTTATAAGTTTLTVTSTYLQFFTGVTTQTVTLPVASTLALGQQFQIVNNSTGAVTVNSSGANAVIVLAGGTAATLTCILTSGTTAASWSASYWADAVTSGKKLTITGSYTQATSFPASPATDDLCYRTDRRIEYYWDGTRWLSTQLLYVSIPNTDFLLPRTATTLGMCRTANPFAALYAIYVVDAVFHNFITATSTWTLAIIDNDASVATTLATRSTSGDAINTHLSNRVTVNAVVASTVDNLQGEATLVSGTASLYCSFGLTYRLIG